MTQQAVQIQAGTKKVRLSERLKLRFPYGWSNSNIDEDVFIVNVLNRCYLEDIVKCVKFFGFERVKANHVRLTNEMSRQIALRQLNNIERAINELEQRNAS